jgi:hypothetical protein
MVANASVFNREQIFLAHPHRFEFEAFGDLVFIFIFIYDNDFRSVININF